MYNVGILMIIFGLVFTVVNGGQLLTNYRGYVTSKSPNKLKMSVNGITLASSILLIVLGIAYIFIVYSQL
ncbi:hypothetical protein [Enterococcus gallinarum]|uniref:hypothetical protein n=1 Tax=Enterococcus gallinarum TaxID=1353 RepID=UPI001D17476E|nr:hypothetical protein [Enterococcus gallinarum]MCC4045672.1 hypothetical protein [Enterococcus gallinarum]